MKWRMRILQHYITHTVHLEYMAAIMSIIILIMPVSFLSPLSSSLLWTRCWEMEVKGILPALKRGLQGGLTQQVCGLIPFTLSLSFNLGGQC